MAQKRDKSDVKLLKEIIIYLIGKESKNKFQEGLILQIIFFSLQ